VPLDYNVLGDELRIGWTSLTPISLKTSEKLLTLKVKLHCTLGKNETIGFNLASDPLNELADGNAVVIPDAVLYIDMIGSSVKGVNVTNESSNLTLTNYPNPFTGTTTFAYCLPVDGEVTLEIRGILGSIMNIPVNKSIQAAGDHTLTVDVNALAPGVYTATIRLNTGGQL